MAEPLIINERVWVPAAALEVRAVRASGPGGQNVNKVASKVELYVALGAIVGLSEDQRARLAQLAAARLDADGQLRLTSQLTRDQARNLEDARAKLAALVRAALVAPRPRRPTRPTRGSRERRLDAKRRTGERKRDRSWRED